MDSLLAIMGFMGKLIDLFCKVIPVFPNYIQQDVSGRWVATWTYKGTQNVDTVELRKVFSWVRGKSYNPKQVCRIKGRVTSDGFFLGEWSDCDPKVAWDGTFQLAIAKNGKLMLGKWTGKTNGAVNAGNWKWQRS